MEGQDSNENDPVVEKDEEQNSIPEDDDEDDDDDCQENSGGEDESPGEKWIDVRELEKMTLDELKQLGLDERSDEIDKRLDPPITKVIIRRLPPQITIEGYLQELSEVPKYTYIRLVPPNEELPSRIGKRSAIYINFETEQEAFWFKEKYNKMKFFDERGNSYIACVDFSFFQDVLKDPLDETQLITLEQSEVFENFLKKYEEDPWSFTMVRPDSTPTPEIMLEEIMNKKVVESDSTPLLQFLRERSEKKEAARKEREVKRKERETARREIKEREKEKQRERREKDKEKRKERERERQKERDRERRLRKERERAAERQDAGKESTNKTKEANADFVSNLKDRPIKKEDRWKQVGKEKEDKDLKQKPVSVTYSRSGNPTRWSENSGPRKGGKHRDDRRTSQEKLNSSASDLSSKPEPLVSDKASVEKEMPQANADNRQPGAKTGDKTKSAFGKPFPVKETKKSYEKLYEDSSDKIRRTESTDLKKTDGNKIENSKNPSENVTIKKKIVKKVIKVRKVIKDDGNGGAGEGETSQPQESSETKPRKIIRVVKKNKSCDDVESKSAPVLTTKKEDVVEKGAGDAGLAHEGKLQSEKERKNKKGRPEIQIYRPGSLRASGSKSTSSGDKDRNDSSSSAPQTNNTSTT